ncbi:MAG: TRAM domain-containing protein, partial [Candidatus Omnitrophica bacterium]|nr:TRAM domain-containing protein [Candidatus Omnitrophota bacterium]
NFKGQLSQKQKQERFDIIMSEQQKISALVNDRLMGKSIPVLIEEKENGAYIGRSENDAPEVDGVVYVNSDKALKAGEFVKVKITDTLEYDLVGEVNS